MFSIFKTVDSMYCADPQRDTGGLGTVFLFWVLGYIVNILNTFYAYLISDHLISILLVYLLRYILFIFYISRLEGTLEKINRDKMLWIN